MANDGRARRRAVLVVLITTLLFLGLASARALGVQRTRDEARAPHADEVAAPGPNPAANASSQRNLTVLVEGFRWVPHSYSVVNSFHLLALARIARRRELGRGLRLYVRDTPFFRVPPGARNASDPDTESPAQLAQREADVPPLLPANLHARLAELRPLPPGVIPDVVVRHAVPWDLGPAEPWWVEPGALTAHGAVPLVMVSTTEARVAPRQAKTGTVRRQRYHRIVDHACSR